MSTSYPEAPNGCVRSAMVCLKIIERQGTPFWVTVSASRVLACEPSRLPRPWPRPCHLLPAHAPDWPQEGTVTATLAQALPLNRCRVRHAADLLLASPLPARGHPPCCLALSPSR